MSTRKNPSAVALGRLGGAAGRGKSKSRVIARNGGRGTIIAFCVNNPEDDDTPSAEEAANARLIAAAPDLLAALRSVPGATAEILTGADDSALCGCAMTIGHIRQLQSAIARAEGRAA